LLRLAQITGGAAYHDIAGRALAVFAGRMTAAPAALPQMFAALEQSRAKPRQIVLVGGKDAAAPFLRELNRRYLPNDFVLLIDSEESRRALARHAPEIEGMKEIGGGATAYVCENFACQLPVTGAEAFGRTLDTVRGVSSG
jgi:hypothetical protein